MTNPVPSAEVETITSSSTSAPNTTTLVHSTALSNNSISSSTVSDLLASSSYSLSTASDLLATTSHPVSAVSDLLATSSHPVGTTSDLLVTTSHPMSRVSDLVSTSSHLVSTVSDLHSLLVTDIPTCSTISNPSNHDQSPSLSVQSNHQPTQMSANLDLGNNCVTTTQLFCPINNFLTMSSFPHNPSADLLELSSDGISPVSSFSTSGQNITINSHSSQSPVQSTHAESSNNEVLDPDNVLDALGNIDDLYGWDSNILRSASPEGIHVTKPLII